MPQAKNKRQNQATANSGDAASRIVGISAIQMPKQEQPRRYFAADKMAQLVASVQEHGILEPLIVRPTGAGKYELVAGERRLRAAKELGLAEVPVVVREFSDQQAYEVALLENLQRDDLNPIDETEGVLHLLHKEIELSKDEVIRLLNRAAHAKRRGIALALLDQQKMELVDQLFLKIGRLNAESFRTNRLPLLNMPDDVLQVLRQGELEYTKAKAISKLEKVLQRKRLMKEAILNNLSLAQIKQKVRAMQEESQEVSLDKQLRASLVALTKHKSAAWRDDTKQKTLRKLILEIEELLQS